MLRIQSGFIVPQTRVLLVISPTLQSESFISHTVIFHNKTQSVNKIIDVKSSSTPKAAECDQSHLGSEILPLCLALYGKEEMDRGQTVVIKSQWNFKKSLVSFCLLSKFGKVDRRWCPRGSVFEPGADEEQPMGGERKMHPSLEETTPSCPINFNHADQHTPTDDP